MQFIQVHEVRGGQDTIPGIITWDGVSLLAVPPTDDVLLGMIEEVQSSLSPLDELHQKFRGAYLHTTPPMSADAQPAQSS